MSRDIYVQDIPAGVRSAADIPPDFRPAPLPFDRAAVLAAVLELAPHADVTDPDWVVVDLPGVSIEVNSRDRTPFRSFALHVRGEPEAADAFVARLLTRLGARAFDTGGTAGTGIVGGR